MSTQSPDGVLVWLVRSVQGRTFARPARLPIAPFPGLGLPLDPDGDPAVIDHVFISYNGAVVCYMTHVAYEVPRDVSEADLESQIAFHTRGWARMQDRGCQHYNLPLPPESSLPLHPPRESNRCFVSTEEART